jgi:hypothetical protein
MLDVNIYIKLKQIPVKIAPAQYLRKMHNGHKIYNMVIKYTKWPLNIAIFSIPCPRKYTKTGIFGI